MSLEQLLGRYSRLARELALAKRNSPLNTAWITRLEDEVAETAREIVALQPVDEQFGECLLTERLHARIVTPCGRTDRDHAYGPLASVDSRSDAALASSTSAAFATSNRLRQGRSPQAPDRYTHLRSAVTPKHRGVAP